MDRTEHKLRLVHSLGELQPMHNYTTEVPRQRAARARTQTRAASARRHPCPVRRALAHAAPTARPPAQYGNSLTRPSKHKALLAGAIEIRVAKDEVRTDC